MSHKVHILTTVQPHKDVFYCHCCRLCGNYTHRLNEGARQDVGFSVNAVQDIVVVLALVGS